jgi:hypothetical protein
MPLADLVGRLPGASGAIRGASDAIRGGGVLLFFVLITVILILVAITYIVYRIRRSDLQSVTIVKNPYRLFEQARVREFDSNKLPITLNGQEFTFSFWVYIASLTPASGPRLIFMRSTDDQSLGTASPLVFLDSTSNRMHFAVRTNIAARLPNLSAAINGSEYGYANAVVDYVPLQRWVNYVMTVRDNLLSVYQDGDIYTVENVRELRRTGSTARPVFSGLNGSVFIGKIPGTYEIRGFIARLQFFNYALMQRDVKSLYREGPSPYNIMSRFGIDEYGIRSPVYKVTDASPSEDDAVDYADG